MIFAVSVACFAVFATSVQAAVFSGTVSVRGVNRAGSGAFSCSHIPVKVGSVA